MAQHIIDRVEHGRVPPGVLCQGHYFRRIVEEHGPLIGRHAHRFIDRGIKRRFALQVAELGAVQNIREMGVEAQVVPREVTTPL